MRRIVMEITEDIKNIDLKILEILRSF